MCVYAWLYICIYICHMMHTYCTFVFNSLLVGLYFHHCVSLLCTCDTCTDVKVKSNLNTHNKCTKIPTFNCQQQLSSQCGLSPPKPNTQHRSLPARELIF